MCRFMINKNYIEQKYGITVWEEMWDIKKHNHGIKGGIWCGKKCGTQCCEKTWDMKTTCFVGRNVGYYMKKRC